MLKNPSHALTTPDIHGTITGADGWEFLYDSEYLSLKFNLGCSDCIYKQDKNFKLGLGKIKKFREIGQKFILHMRESLISFICVIKLARSKTKSQKKKQVGGDFELKGNKLGGNSLNTEEHSQPCPENAHNPYL